MRSPSFAAWRSHQPACCEASAPTPSDRPHLSRRPLPALRRRGPCMWRSVLPAATHGGGQSVCNCYAKAAMLGATGDRVSGRGHVMDEQSIEERIAGLERQVSLAARPDPAAHRRREPCPPCPSCISAPLQPCCRYVAACPPRSPYLALPHRRVEPGRSGRSAPGLHARRGLGYPAVPAPQHPVGPRQRERREQRQRRPVAEQMRGVGRGVHLFRPAA